MLGDKQLEPFDGICYVTDLDGIIKSVGRTNWNAFSFENGAPNLTASDVIGKNVLSYISGEEIRDQISNILQQIASKKRLKWIMPYRCDSANRTRNMRLSITPISDQGKAVGFLFQSILLNENERPAIDLFDFVEKMEQLEKLRDLVIITMCGFCQKVKDTPNTKDKWVEAEAYYAMGGTSNVRVSHGICPSCYKACD